MQLQPQAWPEGHPMQGITTIGIDLAKHRLGLQGVDDRGSTILGETLTRTQAPPGGRRPKSRPGDGERKREKPQGRAKLAKRRVYGRLLTVVERLLA